MERVIESIRVNAHKSPPTPWSDYAKSVPIPNENPFLEMIHYEMRGADEKISTKGNLRHIHIAAPLHHPHQHFSNV